MHDDDWRRDMVRRHPRLFTEISGRELQVTAIPNVGDGWRDVLERAMDRLEGVLDDSLAGRIVIRDIKQKFGGLRVYIATEHLDDQQANRADDIVFLAECRAAGTCETCGAKGRLWSGDGWVRTACDVHAAGRPLGADNPDSFITTRTWVGDAVVTRIWRYDRETDRLIEIDPS